MAGWYLRRGEKVVGPLSASKLQESLAAGKALPTDEVSKSLAGPWTPLSKTRLADDAPAPPPKNLPTKARPAELIVPKEPDEQPARSPAIMSAGKAMFVAMTTSIATTGKAIGRVMAVRAERKHELRMAKVQADAVANAGRRDQPATHGSSSPVQQVSQTTVVNVVQKVSGGSSGCAGCLGCLGLIVIAIVVIAALSRGGKTPTSPNDPKKTTTSATRAAPEPPSSTASAPAQPSTATSTAAAPADTSTIESPPTAEPLLAPETSPTSTESDREKSERRARGNLDLGRSFLRRGKDDDGRRWLQDLIKEFPGTPAAAEAQDILDGKLKP